jgi:tyrosinase
VEKYWDWPRYVAAPQSSPIFNGDAYSMSGNGEYIPGHNGTTLNLVLNGKTLQLLYLEPGLGGGCVKTGPFAKMSVNLGPVALPGGTPPGPNDGLGYNPRCLKRDVGPAVALKYTNITAVTSKFFSPPSCQ